MALFNFRLRPVAEIQPWGRATDLSLSWFGLTDGCYWIDAGGNELFRSSEQALAKWSPDPFAGPYIDYQVVRLYEDVIDILPEILVPLPPTLWPLIRSAYNQPSWRDHCWAFWNSNRVGDEAEEDVAYLAEEWVSRRKIDTCYLTCGPVIWIWREADLITIGWDNTNCQVLGEKAWASEKGTFSLSIEDFLAEMTSFHDRLMAEMDQRIEAIVANWARPEIRIDFEWLVKEHEQRRGTLESALRRKPKDLDEVAIMEAIDRISEMARPMD